MMAKVPVVTSGKGGVGKTTSTAALGAALAQAGQKVVVVDFDVGLRNLDLVMGAERRVVFDLIKITQGVAKLSQALIRDKWLETLYLLPASQSRDKDALTEQGVAGVIKELHGQFDWVICDSPAGIERGATLMNSARPSAAGPSGPRDRACTIVPKGNHTNAPYTTVTSALAPGLLRLQLPNIYAALRTI